MNAKKTKLMTISKQTIFITDYDRSKTLMDNVEYFNYLGSLITNDERCTCEIRSRTSMAKAGFNKKKILFTKLIGLNLRKKIMKCYILSIALYIAETGTLRQGDQKYLDSFEMWCWRMMEHLYRSYDEVLHRLKDERNILRAMKRRKANWIAYIFRGNCLLEHVTEGKIERTGIRGRRHKHLLEDFKDKEGYWKFKEDTRSHPVAELALEEAMYQSQGRLRLRNKANAKQSFTNMRNTCPCSAVCC